MKRLLLVEDEQHLAVIIQYNLEAEGYEVLLAADGPAALKIIEDDPLGIDLVILDIMLPGMSGYAVCEAIRGQGLDVPVLILSARTLTEDRIRGFDVGADQYLQKPFDLDELLSRVKNLLGRRPRSGAARPAEQELHTYEFGRAKINFDTFEASVAGEPLHLTHTEMKLLRYFIEQEGSVISRSQLLEDVWGFANTPTTRTVDNFIVKLRKYFELDPSEPQHFLSVRGAGYRFIAKPAPAASEPPA
ncbi:MAG TPA: response regulator transcription factor [Pirellulales bacterium]|nr:response regulator transcription factor [Pirellulales bacterium]